YLNAFRPLLNRSHLVGQCLSHEPCSRDISFGVCQFAPFRPGKVRWLAEYQELVERVYTESLNQLQTCREPHAAEQTHCLIERETARKTQRAVRTPQLVLDNIASVTPQHSTRFLLALDDMTHDVCQVVDQLLFGTTERCLIGNLEETSQHLAAFAVQSAVRQSHLLQ